MDNVAAVDQNAQENLNSDISEPTNKIQQYEPVSDNCNTTGTVVPLALKYEQAKALETVERRVNGLDIYVQEKLEYGALSDLCKMFSAEQIDSIALFIYNLEQRQVATIVGDGTGVGKGRQAAALIRYAHKHNIIPVFITEKPNLFTDIYRDLIDIKGDDGVVLKHLLKEKKKQKKRVTKKEVESAIIDDINDGDFSLDYSVALLQENLNADSTEFIATFRKTDIYKQMFNEYLDANFAAEYEDVENYILNKNYAKDYQAAENKMRPFVVNGKTPKTIIQDKSGNIIYEPNTSLVNTVIQGGDFELYEDGDVIMATYSQFRSARPSKKKEWLLRIAPRCLFILDESHNSAGASNTGAYFAELIAASKGVVYFSATFAKRPDNMPIYASKTSIGDANLNTEQLIAAFNAGGVALQEVVSAQLTKEGQYIRRERSYEGVTVEYRVMDESQESDYQMPQLNLAEIHTSYCDRVTEIIRDVIGFQKDIVDKKVDKLDDDLARAQGGAKIAKSDREGGISNSPAFSGIFNLINQLLMSINAEATAILAIEEMRNGRKPIIALSNTMESFLDNVTNMSGEQVQIGDVININFKHVLAKRLKNAMRYREDLGGGEVQTKYFTPEELGQEGYAKFNYIQQKIDNCATELIFSPIDYIRKRIVDAGFTFGEVTGRDRMIEILEDGTGMVVARPNPGVTQIFREYNSNIIDCMLINQSGATGVSGHSAIVKDKVDVVNYDKAGLRIIPNSLEPKNEVKQRTMIIMQAELDISFEVQKRGRVNRTGQEFPPRYIYVTSAIPAQQRLLMMLQKKLKSLDANSSGNQKQSTKILDIADFLNKVGDNVVLEFLKKNLHINAMIGDPLHLVQEDESINIEAAKLMPDRANKVAGRVAILAVSLQREFYDTMANMYRQEVERLKQIDEYDLEMEFLNYHAKTIAKTVIQPGDLSKKQNYFTRAVLLEKIEIDNLKKPFRMEEIQAIIVKNLTITTESGENITQPLSGYSKSLILEMTNYYKTRLENNLTYIDYRYDKRIAEIREKGEKSRSQAETKEVELDIEPVLFAPEEGGAEVVKQKAIKPKVSVKKVITKEQTDAEVAEMQIAREDAIKEEKSTIEDTINRNTKIFEYFLPGRMYKFPRANYDEDGSHQYSMFMGYKISRNMSFSNPWAASAIELEFAMDNSLKQINMPSNRSEISKIRALNDSWFFENQANLINDWNDLIKESSANRLIRYVLTGNLLKSFTAAGQLGEQFSGGRLVSFNLQDNPKLIRAGYLLPSTYTLVGKGLESINISVPINMLNQYFKETSSPDSILRYRASDALEIFVSANSITLNFKGSKSEYKVYLADKRLIELFGTDFRVSQGQAVIAASGQNLKYTAEIIDYLWTEYKITVQVSQAMAENLGINMAEDYDDTEEIIDPLVEVNSEFSKEEEMRKLLAAATQEEDESQAESAKQEMVRLLNVERRVTAEKKLDQFIKMLI